MTVDAILLPIPDACRALGIGRSKLYELIAAGDITIRKIGRKTLVPRADIAAFVARLTADMANRKSEAA
jgi:excisionase family DNA binding protein